MVDGEVLLWLVVRIGTFFFLRVVLCVLCELCGDVFVSPSLPVKAAQELNRGDAEVAEFSRREKAAELNQRFDDAENHAETTGKTTERTEDTETNTQRAYFTASSTIFISSSVSS